MAPKRTDPEGMERLTFLMPVDTKKLLHRIAFETETPMADMLRRLVEDWLIGTTLPTGVRLPRRLDAIRIARQEKR